MRVFVRDFSYVRSFMRATKMINFYEYMNRIKIQLQLYLVSHHSI